MRTRRNPSRSLREFQDEEKGSYALEAVLIFPMIVFGYMGMFIFFDAFRQQNANLKASYTISDILSRQTTAVDGAWLGGLNQMLDYLTRSNHRTYVRATVVWWDAESGRHVKIWSEGSDGIAGLDQDEISRELSPQIPVMAHATTAIVLETFMMYEPALNVGIGPTEFHNVIVTRPRFADQLCWTECGEYGSVTVHDDGTDDGSVTLPVPVDGGPAI